MALTRYKLGDLIEQCDKRNNDGLLSVDAVKGISTEKAFIETKANMDGVSLRSYKIVDEDEFAYVADTSRRGDKIAIAYNRNDGTIMVSAIYSVFYVSRTDLLRPEYLFMYFNRPEFDRFSRFNSWGSARETFNWEDLCDIDIELPSIQIQQKYVDIYNAMLANQQSYERGLEDLKLVCDAYIDEIRKKLPHIELGNYISLCDSKNDKLEYGINSVIGISIEKKFIDTKANMEGVSLKPYSVVKPNEFAYVTVTSRNGDKISLARNSSNEAYICSSSYIVFKINKPEELLPEYLSMLFEQDEFDRYSRFNSWGSARETFDWEEMCNVRIPLPHIEIQRDIVNIFEACNERKGINEKLKTQIKDICPILIKGSIEEALKTKEA